MPGFDLFQGPARWLVVTLAALCALAGFGMQQVIDRGVSRKAATRLILFGLALSLAGLAASFVLKGRVETFGPATLRLGALLLLAGWLFRSDLRQPKWIAALVFVVALDLITAHFALNPTLPPEIYRAANPTAEAIAADGSIGRVFTFARDEEQIKFGRYLAHETPDGKRQFDGFGSNDLNYWLGERAALLPNAAMIDRLAVGEQLRFAAGGTLSKPARSNRGNAVGAGTAGVEPHARWLPRQSARTGSADRGAHA